MGSYSEGKMEKIGKRYIGKVAIITASTQGIGLCIAERLGMEGASVVISSHKQKNVDEAVEMLYSKGINVLGVVCHVSNAEQRKHMIYLTIQKFGKIDVIVSNAAVNPTPDTILNTQESALDKLREVKCESSYTSSPGCCIPFDKGVSHHIYLLSYCLSANAFDDYVWTNIISDNHLSRGQI